MIPKLSNLLHLGANAILAAAMMACTRPGSKARTHAHVFYQKMSSEIYGQLSQVEDRGGSGYELSVDDIRKIVYSQGAQELFVLKEAIRGDLVNLSIKNAIVVKLGDGSFRGLLHSTEGFKVDNDVLDHYQRVEN